VKNIILLLSLILSTKAFSQTGEVTSVLDPSLHKDYKESKCYQEFNGVYKKAMQRAQNSLNFKVNLAVNYGVTLNNSSSNSDWGKMERSIANAADYISDSTSSYMLNDFHEIHIKASKKYPEITKEQTQALIRKGFQSEKFCNHWFFSSRYSTNQVARYVKKEFKKYLEEEGRSPAVNDSSMDKDELEDSMNNELRYNGESEDESIEN
jgi:hypothetical protein